MKRQVLIDMSGYDEEPDYGGPQTRPWFHYVLIVGLFFIVGAIYTACTRPDLVKLLLDAN